MLQITEKDLDSVQLRSNTIADTLMDNYPEALAAMAPDATDFIHMGGADIDSNSTNPYEFFFEYMSTCCRVTYPKVHDVVMDLAMLDNRNDIAMTISALALDNVPYVETPAGGHVLTEAFWAEHSATFGVETQFTEDGTFQIDVLINASIMDYEYETMIKILSAMQYIVFIIDSLAGRVGADGPGALSQV